MKKKICYLFVFDHFNDHEASMAATNICGGGEYILRTVAISKEPVKASSGMTVLPDIDFIPEVDLNDIDSSNTAMLILPGVNEDIMPLVNHCVMHDIQIISLSSSPEPKTSNIYAESYS